MRKIYWFQTSDPDVVVCIPNDSGDGILVYDRTFAHETDDYSPPDDFTFESAGIPSALDSDAQRRVSEAVARWCEYDSPIDVRFGRMVVTLSR